MKKNKNNIIILAVIAVVVFGLIFGIITITQNWGKSKDTVDTESAMKTLDRLYQRVRINTPAPRKANVDLSELSLTESLPDISMYPYVVEPVTLDYIEIFSSPEKAGSSYESWLIDVANSFNRSGVTVDGNPVSVCIRNISSGLGVDYIVSGKYVPDVFAPSTELWGDMLVYKGVDVTLAEKSIAGNVAGIVLS